MPHCILNQRLQDQLRNQSLLYSGFNVVIHLELIFKASFHNFEIHARDFEFLDEANLRLTSSTQGKTQKIAETRNHRIGGLYVFVHDRRNHVECIEEKMRI